jgi:ribosomal protein S18 acetylase RimI-like enzyme
MTQLAISLLQEHDIPEIVLAFESLGWDKPTSLYDYYFQEQQENLRMVFVAKNNGIFAGYVTIRWESPYDSFKNQKIPEIIDLNVLPHFRKQGIGSALIAACEESSRKRGNAKVGLGVGVTADYGSAQRLYVRLGYVPDGHGLYYKKHQVLHGDMIVIDDEVALHFTKTL